MVHSLIEADVSQAVPAIQWVPFITAHSQFIRCMCCVYSIYIECTTTIEWANRSIRIAIAFTSRPYFCACSCVCAIFITAMTLSSSIARHSICVYKNCDVLGARCLNWISIASHKRNQFSAATKWYCMVAAAAVAHTHTACASTISSYMTAMLTTTRMMTGWWNDGRTDGWGGNEFD